MARGGGAEWWRVARWCSYKRAAITVCCVNLVAALFVFRSLYVSLHLLSPAEIPHSFTDLKLNGDEMERAKQSIRIGNESVPFELVKLVKGLREELSSGGRWELPPAMMKMIGDEILERLRGVKDQSNVTEQQEVIQLWRIEKLKALKMTTISNSSSNSSTVAQEAKMLERSLGSAWQKVSEDIGLWMPEDVNNYAISDKPENEQELDEEEIIPGQPLPSECHAEPHTDYNGVAVRWGLTHHKNSAADCCRACLDQANRTKPGQMKCNIWVYCPSEAGCYSPDIYEHRRQECWLKQAQTPQLNFKHKYPQSYRKSHPKAPVVVPWISGVITGLDDKLRVPYSDYKGPLATQKPYSLKSSSSQSLHSIKAIARSNQATFIKWRRCRLVLDRERQGSN